MQKRNVRDVELSHVDLINQDVCGSVENGRKKGPVKGVLWGYLPKRGSRGRAC
jgi:hypothetical protein